MKMITLLEGVVFNFSASKASDNFFNFFNFSASKASYNSFLFQENHFGNPNASLISRICSSVMPSGSKPMFLAAI